MKRRKNAPMVNSHLALNVIIDSLSVNKSALSFKIEKNAYRLGVMADTLVIKEYAVVFGKNPVNDKRMEGDKCTPEGVFSVRNFYRHDKWSKFIWIDYPTADSWNKHKRAKRAGQIPETAMIGGEIGIHGAPEGRDNVINQKLNWTLGCISLKNKDVDEIYTIVRKGMNVEIVR